MCIQNICNSQFDLNVCIHIDIDRGVTTDLYTISNINKHKTKLILSTSSLLHKSIANFNMEYK